MDDTEKQEITAILKQARLSVTKVRKSILKFLIENHGPFSIDEIHKNVMVENCDYATVYRCIKKFEEGELVKRCDFGDNIARYEYKKFSHHHHIMCKVCNKVEVIQYCFLPEMEKMIKDWGYKDVNHSLEFFGICQDCQ